MISSASSAGEASMNLSGWNRASRRVAERGRRGRASASRPMSPVSIPAHFTSSSGRSNAFAIAASSRPSRSPMRSSPPSTLTMYVAVSGSARASRSREDGGLARPGRRRPRSRRTRRRPRGASGDGPAGSWPAALEDVGDGEAEVGVPVVGGAERRRGRPPATSATVVTIADQPRPVARWSASGNGRPVRKTAAIGQLVGRRGCGGSRRAARSSRTSGSWPRRARPARSSGAWRGWYTVPSHGGSDVVPGVDHRPDGRPAAARAREPDGVPALVRGPRDRPARALPGGADAARGDRALLRAPGSSARRRSRWPSTSARRTG